MREVALMNKQRRILLVGSRAFANIVAGLLESCEDVETLHTTCVTINLFLTRWRPDCAIIDCDNLAQEPLAEIEALSRFRPTVPIVLICSNCISQLAGPAVSAILRPSEMNPMLAPLVASLVNQTSHCSA